MISLGAVLAAGSLCFAAGLVRQEVSVIPGCGALLQTAEADEEALQTPELISVKLLDNGSTDKAVLRWNSVKGLDYRILRKNPGGKWKTIGGVTASDTTSKYVDKGLDPDKTYVYTVRSRVRVSDNTYQYSKFDTEGIETIRGTIEAKVSIENLSAAVTWNSLNNSGVSDIRYIVYRGFYGSSDLRAIATVSKTSYTDVYYKTFNSSEKQKYMLSHNQYTQDPSNNLNRYVIRPRKKYSSGKLSYGKYDAGGVFKLAMPVITDIERSDGTAQITWGSVPFAEKYLIYVGKKTSSGMKWVKKAAVAAKNKDFLQAEITIPNSYPYLMVRASAVCQGETIHSPFDSGFRTDLSNYSDKNILFVGDSILYGAPYQTAVYSIPQRVQSLLGTYVYNGSISGGTYSENSSEDKTITTDSLEQILYGEAPCAKTYERNNNELPKRLAQYDVIVLGAGTNDYGSNVALGDPDSTDQTTFYGALNKINTYIKKANAIRESKGKESVKVIYLELFFRYKRGAFYLLNDCSVVKNSQGLTLTAYNNAVKASMKKLEAAGISTYYFETSDFVNKNNCLSVTYDNLHLTRVTYAKIGNKMAAAIKKLL